MPSTEPPRPSPQDGAGDPDGFQRLWMPHRMAYIKGGDETHGKGPGSGAGSRPEESCPFCRAPTLPDEEGLVVARGELAYAVLNLYPYNGGHVMICPYRHVADYTDLSAAETAEFGALTKRAIRALREASAA